MNCVKAERARGEKRGKIELGEEGFGGRTEETREEHEAQKVSNEIVFSSINNCLSFSHNSSFIE